MKFPRLYVKRQNRLEIDPEDIFIDSKNVSSLDRETLEGTFTKSISIKIFTLAHIIVLAVFILFGYKSYKLQILENTHFQDLAQKNYIRKTPIFAGRGVIKDKNGVLLAWNEDIEDKVNNIPKRFYIKDVGLSSVIGHISYPKKDKGGVFWQNEYVGEAGLEKQYNAELSGVNGERIIEVSAKKEISKTNIINLGEQGVTINTYLDSKVNEVFYNKLKEVVEVQGFKGGSAVMMNVNNGEVVAMVNYPDYDNNIFINASTTKERSLKDSYLEDKATPMLNRAVSGLYTPGSTVKPFIAYAALFENVIKEFDNIYSSGQLVIKNKYGGPDTVFKDWKAHGYVDARSAIAESSDEYFYQIGGGYMDQKGLGIKRIEKYMNYFGFATSTGVDLPLEKSGIVPSPEWKALNFKEGDWLLGNTYHTSIGQYGFKTTPLELARSIAVIANGGKIITPKIASTSNSVKQSEIKLDKSALKVVKEGMRMAAGEKGTAHYFSDLPFKVAAKTGTAELGVNKDRVNSWSTGYFPYENPEYVFVFLMENGPVTNTVASSKIMRKVFDDLLYLTPEYFEFSK
jgi:penicillin-binding protein 2